MRLVLCGYTCLAVILGSCTVAEVETTASPHIIGGSLAPADDAVVMLNIGCTGTLIAPNVVLTAAHCIPSFGVQFGLRQGSFFASRNAIKEVVARNYGAGLFAGGDVALILLASDAPPEIQPIPLYVTPLTNADIGRAIRLVGYGVDENDNSGTRRQITVAINSFDETLMSVGSTNNTSCFGDSGGPGFLDVDGVEHVAGITSFGAGDCTDGGKYTRVDAYLETLILQVVDAWSGPCRFDGVCDEQVVCPGFADPDCDACGMQGECAAGCQDKDLDCPVGSFDGGECSDREDCESLLCIAAPEDARVKFCSTACDEANGVYCSGVLSECAPGAGPGGESVCVFAGYSPGVQGAHCLVGTDCRSGQCDPDDGICIEQCSVEADCAAGFVCRGFGSQSACRLPGPSGCQVGGGEGGSVVLLALAGLLLALRRRRAP